MKKIILLGIFSIAFLLAKTQVVTFKIGPTFSQINGERSFVSTESYLDENYVGFYTSLGLDYLQKKGFSLSSNIGFYTTGGKDTVKLSDEMGNIIGDSTFTTKLDFITLNTIAKYNFIAEKKVSPFVGLGIGLNYLVSYDDDFKILDNFDRSDELNILLWGLIGTAGVNIDLNKIRLGAEFMYNYNLNKMIDYESIGGTSTQLRVNYYSVLFSVGYKLK
jgi:hypothetical protein